MSVQAVVPVSEERVIPEELIYEYTPLFTQVVDVAILMEGSSLFQLKENVTLRSNHPECAWVNPIQVWAPGTVDVAKGEIRIKAHAV